MLIWISLFLFSGSPFILYKDMFDFRLTGSLINSCHYWSLSFTLHNVLLYIYLFLKFSVISGTCIFVIFTFVNVHDVHVITCRCFDVLMLNMYLQVFDQSLYVLMFYDVLMHPIFVLFRTCMFYKINVHNVYMYVLCQFQRLVTLSNTCILPRPSTQHVKCSS